MARKMYQLGEHTPCGRLPKNVTFVCDNPIELDSNEVSVGDSDEIVDKVSDTYGFCIVSCDVSYSSEGNMVYVTNIQWDITD